MEVLWQRAGALLIVALLAIGSTPFATRRDASRTFRHMSGPIARTSSGRVRARSSPEFGHSHPPELLRSFQEETTVDLTTILIQVISGAVGGNVGGMLNKAKSLGPLLNTVLGAVGGVGGGQLLGSVLTGLLGGNATAGNVSASALVGLLLPLLGSLLKKKTA
jgi:hypothetical protein